MKFPSYFSSFISGFAYIIFFFFFCFFRKSFLTKDFFLFIFSTNRRCTSSGRQSNIVTMSFGSSIQRQSIHGIVVSWWRWHSIIQVSWYHRKLITIRTFLRYAWNWLIFFHSKCAVVSHLEWKIPQKQHSGFRLPIHYSLFPDSLYVYFGFHSFCWIARIPDNFLLVLQNNAMKWNKNNQKICSIQIQHTQSMHI